MVYDINMKKKMDNFYINFNPLRKNNDSIIEIGRRDKT